MTEPRSDPVGDPAIRALIRRALRENLGRDGDLTTRALVAPRTRAIGRILARTACTVAGVSIAESVFQRLDPRAVFERHAADGATVKPDSPILTIRGRAAALLTAERTALNLMQRMTGIATLTARFVDAVRPYPVRILDTRKTTPTLRALEKYAVRCGGGTNHRMGLFDMALLKDNHRFLWSTTDTPDLAAAVRRVRARFPATPIEVEVESLDEFRAVLPERPDWIMLDNMSLDLMRECVRCNGGTVQLEASGGVTLGRVHDIAATGVNAISIGALTHSAPAADLSMELAP